MLIAGLGVHSYRHVAASAKATTGSTAALPLPDKPSIAVLPFVNMSEDPKQEYFSDGMTEDIFTSLSKRSGLFVIARNSVFTYKGRAVKPEEVSRELGVRYVLEGSVRKAEKQVRITAQPIDATTGYHLWAERYDGEVKDIFALQDGITQKIVAALAPKLTTAEQSMTGRLETHSIEAYDIVLRGIPLHNQVRKESNAIARQMFPHSLGRQCEFATNPVSCRSRQKPCISKGSFQRPRGTAAVGQLRPFEPHPKICPNRTFAPRGHRSSRQRSRCRTDP